MASAERAADIAEVSVGIEIEGRRPRARSRSHPPLGRGRRLRRARTFIDAQVWIS
jgi:hypothetical protein